MLRKITIELLAQLKNFTTALAEIDDVLDASVFRAIIAPPSRGAFLKKRPDVKIAKFDVVMLVEFKTVDAARHYQYTPE